MYLFFQYICEKLNMIEIKKLIDAGKVEAEWIKYYGESKTRTLEKFNDCFFYDRIKSIGYTKRVVKLYNRCAMMRLTSNTPVLESTIEQLSISNEQRNHSKNIYTALEYLIHNEIEKDKFIKIIKGNESI